MISTLGLQIKMICIESYKLNNWKGKANNAKVMLLINSKHCVNQVQPKLSYFL